jgi:hypothetical protein
MRLLWNVHDRRLYNKFRVRLEQYVFEGFQILTIVLVSTRSLKGKGEFLPLEH